MYTILKMKYIHFAQIVTLFLHNAHVNVLCMDLSFMCLNGVSIALQQDVSVDELGAFCTNHILGQAIKLHKLIIYFHLIYQWSHVVASCGYLRI